MHGLTRSIGVATAAGLLVNGAAVCTAQHNTTARFASAVSTVDPAVQARAATPGRVERVGGNPIAEMTFEDGIYRCGPCATQDASLPEGYPAPTAPGALEIKWYPEVRRAEISTGATPGDRSVSNRLFFPLFRHIQANDIPMTAPVEMDFTQAQGEPTATMSFLYRNTREGRIGPDAGGVEVVDAPPVTVLAFGVRGDVSQRVYERSTEKLEAWLDANPQWEGTGEFRWLGYNGPSVPQRNRWYEVQAYIVPAGESTEAEDGKDPNRTL